MDTWLFDQIHKQDVVKPNARILRGIADEQFAYLREYIHAKLTSHSRHWPKGVDGGPPPLEYVETRRASPEKTAEYMVGNTKKKDRSSFDLKRTRAVMLEIVLRVFGEDRVKPIWFPYPKNNILLLENTEYFISMVLVDELFSVDKKNGGRVFLKSDLDSHSFSRQHYSYYVDGKITHQTLVYTYLYKNQKAKNERNKREKVQHPECIPTILHYLCARQGSGGLSGAIKKYFGCDIAIGDENTINRLDYPEKDYCIVRSIGKKPSLIRGNVEVGWRPCEVVIAYPRKYDCVFIRDLLAAAFYVMDHYPNKLTNKEELDDPDCWLTILSFLYFPWELSMEDRVTQMEQHLQNVFIYFDDNMRDKINQCKEFDMKVEDFYDVMAFMARYILHIIDGSSPGSLFNKKIRTVEFLYSDFFNKVGSAITLAFQKPPKSSGATKTYSQTSISKLIGVTLHRDIAIRELKRNLGLKHKEIRQLNTATPCLAVKTTTSMILQEDVKSGNTSNVDICTREAYYAHSSIISIGSIMRQPKYRPDGRAMMNSQVLLGPDYEVRPHPALSLMHEVTQRNLDRIAYDDDFDDYESLDPGAGSDE